MCRGVPFSPLILSVISVTDFSHGVGEHLGNHQVQGLWIAHKARLLISVLELCAIYCACQQLLPHIEAKTVQVPTDNTTVVLYVNRSGSLCQEAVKLWNLCIWSSVTFWTSHSLGVQNVLVDCLSRFFTLDHKRFHNTAILASVFHTRGFGMVDLFATWQNRKCTQFCSKASHSPVSMIPKVILKLKQD